MAAMKSGHIKTEDAIRLLESDAAEGRVTAAEAVEQLESLYADRLEEMQFLLDCAEGRAAREAKASRNTAALYLSLKDQHAELRKLLGE